MPVDVLEKQAARLAVEGAMRPADLEQGTDGPPGTGPTVRTRPRHRWQSQTAGTRSVTPFCHSVFVLWSSIKGEPNCLAGQPLKIYRRDFSFESLFLSLSLVSFFLSPFFTILPRARVRTHAAKAVLHIRRIGISDNTMEFHTEDRKNLTRAKTFSELDSIRDCEIANICTVEHVNRNLTRDCIVSFFF